MHGTGGVRVGREVAVTKFLAYSRWGDPLFRLRPKAARHLAEINGEDTLEISCPATLAKGDRILWFDGWRWREHVVNEIEQGHSGSARYVCESSLVNELSQAHLRREELGASGCAEALAKALEGTRWAVEEAGGQGEKDVSFEAQSAYQALRDVAGLWGLEYEPVLALSPSGVASRSVRMVPQIGRRGGVRFSYGRGVEGVRKRVLDDDVITACYGYGDGSGDERLWCLVEDSDALERWGLPDGRGGMLHQVGVYENRECSDVERLKDETLAHLRARSVPSVSYEVDIPYLTLRGVQLGDVIQVVDRDFSPELRLEARVGAVERDLMTGETSRATFGTVTSVLPDVLARAYTAARTAASLVGGMAGSISDQIAQEITTGQVNAGQVVIGAEGSAGTLTVGEDGGLYYNGRKIVIETEGQEAGQ
ncbi:hypothetical protein GMI70_02820 [Eggerthellaceae bacterium zg-893]|nr:hypothetical protein [Eggerthellaceae bacterium zg-893]